MQQALRAQAFWQQVWLGVWGQAWKVQWLQLGQQQACQLQRAQSRQVRVPLLGQLEPVFPFCRAQLRAVLQVQVIWGRVGGTN